MTSEGLGEMLEGNSADTCTGGLSGPSSGERGPPSALAEFKKNKQVKFSAANINVK